jgi:hypothetical protein
MTTTETTRLTVAREQGDAVYAANGLRMIQRIDEVFGPRQPWTSSKNLRPVRRLPR